MSAEQISKSQQIAERFGWYAHLAILAGGNVLLIDQMAEVNCHKAIMMLEFKAMTA